MEWKWQCNYCKEILDDKQDVLRHLIIKHRQALLFATPIAVDEWDAVPKKPVKREPIREEPIPKLKQKKPKKGYGYKDEEEDELDEEAMEEENEGLRID